MLAHPVCYHIKLNLLVIIGSRTVSSTHVILVPLSSSGLSIVRVELMEELVIEINVNTRIELQSLTL